jgi:peptidoglycan/LPS O-acetylase OafA/YrhL
VFRGGFIGVDIFFVISGFLITSIIMRDVEAGKFSFADFYARRIRRLFPALLLVLSTSLLAAWLFLPQRDLIRFGLHLSGSAAFVGNLIFESEAGYFDAHPYSKPLLHLWSLGVEEQYYLVWPLLLVLSLKLRRLLPIMLSLAAASFLLNLYHSATAPPAAFFLFPDRAWQLITGGVAAALYRTTPFSARGATWSSSAGALLLLVGFAAITEERPYPDLWGLLPTLGSFLIILAGPSAPINRHILSQRHLVSIGLISYPLYLWHWPLLSFLFMLSLDSFPILWRALAIAAAFAAAGATYRWIERPIRRRQTLSHIYLLIPMVFLAAIGLATFMLGASLWRPLPPDPRVEFLSYYRSVYGMPDQQTPARRCRLGRRHRGISSPDIPAECMASGPRGTWFIWGDSHAAALAVGLRQSVPQGVSLAEATTGGCPPLGKTNNFVCRRSDTYALQHLRRLKPDLVLLVQRHGHLDQDWPAIARRLRSNGAQKVVLVGPVPRWKRGLPQLVATRFWPTPPPFISQEIESEVIAVDRKLRERFRNSPDISYISLVPGLCDSRGCRAVVPGTQPRTLMLVDTSHLSRPGSLYIARSIVVPQLAALRTSTPAKTNKE